MWSRRIRRAIASWYPCTRLAPPMKVPDSTYGSLLHHPWFRLPPPMARSSTTDGSIFHHPWFTLPPPVVRSDTTYGSVRHHLWTGVTALLDAFETINARADSFRECVCTHPGFRRRIPYIRAERTTKPKILHFPSLPLFPGSPHSQHMIVPDTVRRRRAGEW